MNIFGGLGSFLVIMLVCVVKVDGFDVDIVKVVFD